MRTDRARVDVVVVGAGPVGLLAAVELRLAGAGVVVLERLGAPSGVSKALGMGPLGAEALRRRGMGAAIDEASGRSMAAVRAFQERHEAGDRPRPGRVGGHFAGLSLIRVDAQEEPDRRAAFVDQQAVEAMLGDRARALGIEVRRGCEVAALAQDADGVDVDWSSPGGAGRLRCAYLVGSDGGRSTVRKLAGFGFPGTPPTLTMYTAAAEVDHPDRLLPVGWRRTPGGVVSFGPFPGRLFLVDFSGPPADRSAPVTRDEVESVLRRVSGADVRVTGFSGASRWADNTRLVDTYRIGRVLLAGDAAHVHSPFGGQGMSLGLVDAANLGWKLAAVALGARPDALLDSYTSERRPVAEAVLSNTLAQAALMRPDPQSGALRDLMARLLGLDDVNRLIGSLVTGLSTRYDLGPGPDPVGRLIGDRPLGPGAPRPSLYDLMGDGSGVLLDATADGSASRVVADHAPGVRRVAVEAGPSMLIRPDACVAWAGEGGDTAGLEESTRHWFGSTRAGMPAAG